METPSHRTLYLRRAGLLSLAITGLVGVAVAGIHEGKKNRDALHQQQKIDGDWKTRMLLLYSLPECIVETSLKSANWANDIRIPSEYLQQMLTTHGIRECTPQELTKRINLLMSSYGYVLDAEKTKGNDLFYTRSKA